MKRVVEGEARQAVVRRRRYTPEFRRLVAKDTLVAGASVSAVALKDRLNTNMLFTWRRRYPSNVYASLSYEARHA